MTMSTQRLDVLTRLAESRTGRAAEDVARSRSGLNEQEARLQELRRYVDEYRARPLPLKPGLIANRELFLGRLEEAVRQQTRSVEAAVQSLHQSTQFWLERRAGQQKFDALHDAAADRDARQVEERSQKQMDEFGTMAFGRAPDLASD